ncbi:hypothetical protein ABZ891_38630 [Streptomyces sp. NPDC047023]|uniref:hypothetical protein n=1 Tax=Streptomyces sp. NPDC047023 TaxID=3155139 RepID=UPI0033EDE519
MENELAAAVTPSPGRSLAFEALDGPPVAHEAWTKTFCVFCMGTCMKAQTDVPLRRGGRP